ncbi:integrase core domain containing protein [Cucumis melo var. makuwa]|uniref:Integrase core domain containing protein n=1 Tax=Cucumis melo var. makuwa TaxID=1194695 RepID=A0A5D3D6E7_CUCMM|nr:integrase core domain containing protein [Cucumis melo var. makuwa]
MTCSEIVASSSTSTLTKEVINPAFEAWLVVDQLLLRWMYNSMTPKIVTQLMRLEHSKDLWNPIQELFEIQSRVKEEYPRPTFQQTWKGNNSMTEYLRLMKLHSNNLAQACSPFLTRALISQVLLGLDLKTQCSCSNTSRKTKAIMVAKANIIAFI